MPTRAFDRELARRFLEDLSESLDVQKTIIKLGMTGKEARDVLLSLAGRERPREREGRPHLIKGLVHEVYVDGASRGNPGKAGAGAVIKDSTGEVLKELKYYIGIATNNMAEYRALVMALEEARKMGLEAVRVFADSELMVRQINREYRVKSPALLPLYERAVELANGFRAFKITHIPREKNEGADRLANEAIDRGG